MSGISNVGILPVKRVALETFSSRLALGEEAVLEKKKMAVMHKKKRKRSVAGFRTAMFDFVCFNESLRARKVGFRPA